MSEKWVVDDWQSNLAAQESFKPSGWVDIRLGDRTIGSTFGSDYATNLRHAEHIVTAANERDVLIRQRDAMRAALEEAIIKAGAASNLLHNLDLGFQFHMDTETAQKCAAIVDALTKWKFAAKAALAQAEGK